MQGQVGTKQEGTKARSTKVGGHKDRKAQGWEGRRVRKQEDARVGEHKGRRVQVPKAKGVYGQDGKKWEGGRAQQ